MNSEAEILKAQVQALKELIAIKNQIIAELRAKQPLIINPQMPYFPSPFIPCAPLSNPIVTCDSVVIDKDGKGNFPPTTASIPFIGGMWPANISK